MLSKQIKVVMVIAVIGMLSCCSVKSVDASSAFVSGVQKAAVAASRTQRPVPNNVKSGELSVLVPKFAGDSYISQAEQVLETTAAVPTVYANSSLRAAIRGVSIPAGTKVYVFNKKNSAWRVMYAFSSDRYRAVWIPANALNGTKDASVYKEWPAVAKRWCQVYEDENLTICNTQEWIDPEDDLIIKKETANAYYVNYPTGSGKRKERWVTKDVLKEQVIAYIWPIDNHFTVNTLYYYNNYYTKRTGYKHSCHYSHFNALDIKAEMNTPIKSPAHGFVYIQKEQKSGFGNWIKIKHDDGNISLFAHLNKIVVSDGDEVKQGEIVAYSGNSGGTTPHVHLEFSGFNAWKYYRDKVPFYYWKSTLLAYQNRCSQEDKPIFKEAIDWIDQHSTFH